MRIYLDMCSIQRPMDDHAHPRVRAEEASYFCTCDAKLLRRASQVETGATRPVAPLELIEEMER